MKQRLIDANVLKSVFEKWMEGMHSGEDDIENAQGSMLYGCICQLDNTPTVEAEPVRHGRWDGDTCTNCKLPWNDLMRQNGDDYGYFDPMPPFCPNCGAKMDEETT